VRGRGGGGGCRGALKEEQFLFPVLQKMLVIKNYSTKKEKKDYLMHAKCLLRSGRLLFLEGNLKTPL